MAGLSAILDSSFLRLVNTTCTPIWIVDGVAGDSDAKISISKGHMASIEAILSSTHHKM